MNQKVDSKDFELVKNNRNGTSAVELATNIVKQIPVEVWKDGASTLLEQIKNHLDTEREGKKKIREVILENINLEIKNLIENIHKEEAKEDFNQERINIWYDRLDKKQLELKELQDDADGFAKGIIKIGKNLLNRKLEDRNGIGESKL